MGIFSTMMWNAIHMATHGLTTVNKRVETLKSCRRHAKGVVTKVISPLRLLVIILLLLISNIQFHHECYRTYTQLLRRESDKGSRFPVYGEQPVEQGVRLSFDNIHGEIVNFRMLFLQLTGFAAPQRHKGRCIGISKHALMGNNCSTQYILLNRISCYRIDGMSVFPSIFQIEITVVAGSCESQPFRQLHNLFKLGVCSGTVILRSDNANAPIPPLRVLSFRYHFAADVYHIVRYAFAVEQTRGIFDVTCAPLINLWGFGFTKFDSITPQLVDSIRHFVGFRKVRLQGNRVMKDDPRILLNFSVHKLRQISRLFVPTLAWLCGKDCIKLYILRCFLCQVYLYVEYISN